jgi:hypothetical protein
MSVAAWVVVGLVATGVSLYVAEQASGQEGTMEWGLLGPVGWIIAALIGVQKRVDRLRSEVRGAAANRSAPPA